MRQEDIRKLAGRLDAKLDEVLREAYALGFEAGVGSVLHGIKNESLPQKKRDDAIKQAKEDISALSEGISGTYYIKKGQEVGVEITWGISAYATCEVVFHVNESKRAVTALMKGVYTGKVFSIGVAKCHEDDCFNEDIGKAVALRKALRKSINMYMDIPNPTEIREGNIIETEIGNLYEILSVETQNRFTVRGICSGLEYKFIPIVDKYKIVDDTVGGLTE